MNYRVTVLVLVAVASIASSRTLFYKEQAANAPEQVHISYGESPSEMTVTWNTPRAIDKPLVRYGLSEALTASVNGSSTVFVDSGDEKRKLYIHRATMTGLQPGRRYYYRVGSEGGKWSKYFSFVSMRTDPNWAPRFAVFGDLGLVNPQSVPRLMADKEKGMYDAVLHVGDYGYDLATNNSLVGDAYMRMIEPLAANLPYMTCPGNHEYHYNFSNYKARFSMPRDNGRMFYSINIGPIHLISVSTEYYYYFYYGISQIKTQYNWLVKDLEEANKPENRKIRPWIIIMGHRPMYCSNDDGDCGLLAMLLRRGVAFLGYPGLESLLKKYGVDMAIWAHEHSYERIWPTYANVVVNSSTPGKPYLNPKATAHVVTGSAGCQERHDTFGAKKPFSAFRSDDYGYSRMQIFNSTHLAFEQVSDDQDGKIIDQFVLIREKHTPF